MKWRPSRANLFTGLGLLVLLAVVVLGAPRWTRLLTRTVPGEETAPEERREARDDEPAAGAVERRIDVKLFFQSADRPGLVMEERAVPFSGDLAAQLKSVVAELVQGSKSGLLPTLRPETKVLEVFVNARGVAYVDLSKEASAGGGGSYDELLSVYSIVNSLVVNFPAVKRVQILVDDRPADTLAGHIDLTRPLGADMTLLASATVTPAAEPGGGASPPAAASPAPSAVPRS